MTLAFFLCPVSGLILQGDQDDVVEPSSVNNLVKKLYQQKDIKAAMK